MRKILRGEIYNVELTDTKGSEQAGFRPCVIVQNDVGNEYSSTTIVVACTTNISRLFPWEVPLSAEETGLNYSSKAKCDQLRTIAKSRLQKKVGEVPPEKMKQIDRALKISLGLESVE